MSDVTRRGALAAAALAGAGAWMAGEREAEAADDRDRKEKSKELPTFRYAMEKQHGRVTPGGSAKEATVKQLPISTAIAGVSMRLKPGGLRELHWHANAAEWAFVIKGRVRTTVIAPDATVETNDFGPGDVWYFPRGHGHALQGMGPGEAHFVLVFDNGSFSESATFSSTDWLAVTPPDLVARNLGVSEDFVARLPKKELYIAAGRVPPDRQQPLRQKSDKAPKLTHKFPLLAQEPKVHAGGGKEWIVSAREFPISKTITGVIMHLDPGALRELHWHPHANEWVYVIQGKVRIPLFGSKGRSRTEEFSPGDAGYIPQGFGHAIENIGDNEARLLIAFDSGEYQEISLSTWLGANPLGMVADNFALSDAEAGKLPSHKQFLIPKRRPKS
jgi:oxalate decarboxylase